MRLNGRLQWSRVNSKHPNETQQLFCLLRNVEPVWRRCLRSLEGTVFLTPVCGLCRAVGEGRSVHGMHTAKLYVQARMQPASCMPSGHITRFHINLQCTITVCASRWLAQSLITPFARGAANHVNMPLTTNAAALPLPYSSQYHHTLIFEFRYPHASPATALTHQPARHVLSRNSSLSTYRLFLSQQYTKLSLKGQFLLILFTLNLHWPQLWLC